MASGSGSSGADGPGGQGPGGRAAGATGPGPHGSGPDVDALAALLGGLVAIPSPSGEERRVQTFICDWLQARGVEARLEPAADGLVNVIAEVASDRPGPALLFFGHSDTATPGSGWSTDPWSPVRRDGRLYGLGSMDMKAGLAAAMHAVTDLASRRHAWAGKVAFAALADEEAYSRGARAWIDTGVEADGAILCEPHFPAPILGSVGKVNVAVTVHGRAAHGSYPELGVNAVVEAAKLLAVLDRLPMGQHPRIGRGSQCVLRIQGGPETYVIQVPERCEFLVNRHIVPGESGGVAVAQMRRLAEELASEARFEFAIEDPYYPPFLVEETDPFVQDFARAFETVLGTSPAFEYGRGVMDANYLVSEAGVPTVVFGPTGANMHAANEWADLESLQLVTKTYAALAERFLVPTA